MLLMVARFANVMSRTLIIVLPVDQWQIIKPLLICAHLSFVHWKEQSENIFEGI